MTWDDYWGKYSGPKYKLYLMIVAIAVLAAIVYFSGQNKTQFVFPTTTPAPITVTTTPIKTVTTTIATATTPTITKDTGTVVVAVKDVKQKLKGLGDATMLNLTVTSIEIHRAGQDNETGEWITVFNGSKIFDLLDYSEKSIVLGELAIDAGKYTQIRMYVESGTIKIYNALMNVYNKTYPLSIPGKSLKFVHPFTIEANKTVILTLDFDVVESITEKEAIVGIGQAYKFNPTCKECVKIVEQTVAQGQLPDNYVRI